MNKGIYENNMEALKKKYPVWAAILENKRKKRNFDVVAEKSLMGDTILKIKKDGRELYLNGKYAPSAVTERWFEKQETIEEYAPIMSRHLNCSAGRCRKWICLFCSSRIFRLALWWKV